MPYANPAQYLSPFFEPSINNAIRILPSLQHNALAKQQLARQNQQWIEGAPLRQAQITQAAASAAKAQEEADKLKQVRGIFSKLMGSDGTTVPMGTTPADMLKNPFVRDYLGLPQERETPEEAAVKSRAVYESTAELRSKRELADAVEKQKALSPLQTQEAVNRQRALTPGEINAARQKEQILGPMKTDQAVKQAREMIPVGVEKQAAMLPGEISKAQRTQDSSASQELARMKLQTWAAYLNGLPLNQQQKQLIGVDIDPYVARAAQMVAGDLTMIRLPIEEKVARITQTAELMRAQSGQPGAGQPQAQPQQISLPPAVKTTSQAVQFLMQTHGMSKEQAIQWVRENAS